MTARWWRWLRVSETGLVVLALVVGAGAGVGAVVFRWLIRTFTLVLSGHEDFSAATDLTNPHLPYLGRFFVILAPVVAGLLYGPLVHVFAREARGHGVPEVMFAVARRGGHIPAKVAAVKALASALCIGGGGSVGREGPIVQIGSALGSAIGGAARVPEERRRVMLACGAAGGIAATFNAPLAGVFFAMELILTDFAARSFGMVVLASVTSSVIGRAVLGDAPFLDLPTFEVHHVSEFLLFALLGVLAGVVGVGFTRVLYAVEDACDWAWRGPEWLRPAVGGLALGVLLLLLPQMYGVGYPVLGDAVTGAYAVGFLVVLLLGKMLATSLTIGIGGSGGVFAPSLFVGAMLGAAFGQAADLVAPGMTGPAGTYALLGMGAVFAGAARAPITAVVILFELTGEYSIILPLMVAIVLATGVSHLLSRETIYTAKLRRRGVDLSEPVGARRLRETRVATVMGPVGTTVGVRAELDALVPLLEHAPHGLIAVVTEAGDFEGVVTARRLAERLVAGAGAETAGDLAEQPRTLLASSSLAEALPALEGSVVPAVAVLDATAGALVGWLTPRDLLAAETTPA